MRFTPRRVGSAEGQALVVPAAGRPDLSTKEYEQAFLFYCRVPSVKALAKAMSWPEAKAEQIVAFGWPEAGLAPLDARYRELLAQVLDEAGETVKADMRRQAAQARKMSEHMGRLILDGLAGATHMTLLDKYGHVMPAAVKAAIEAYEKVGRFASFASGGADSRAEVSLGVDELSSLMQQATGDVVDVPVADVVEEKEEPAGAQGRWMGGGR